MPTTAARLRRVAHARLSEDEVAELMDTDVDALSLAQARALLQRIDLGGRYPRTERHLLFIRLLFTAATSDARRPLLRIPLQGRRSAAHCLGFVQILNHWDTGEIDERLDEQVASFILQLSDAQWRRMTLTECGYLRAWLIGRLAGRPPAQGIALLLRLHTRTRAHRDIFDHDDVWSCNRLEEWMTAHGESLVPIPQLLVESLLTSENPRGRALAFELLSHPLAPDVATEAAP